MHIKGIKNYLLPTALLLLVGGTAACGKKDNNDRESEADKAVPVTVVQAKEMTYAPNIRFSGSVEASKSANLGTAIPGRIERIHYAKGAFVRKGALIVEMSDEMLMQAQIENNAIKRDFERITRLREKESVSQMDYDHVKAKYEATVAKVALLKKNTSITAPFSGIITEILVNEGETYAFTPSISSDLTLESGIIELRQINPLKVSIEVNEKELRNIQKGQSATIRFDAYPDDTVGGEISYISPVLSAMTRAASVEVSIPNPDNRYKPGMYCNVSIALPERDGLFVPLNAIYRLAGTSEEYVFKINADGTTVSRIAVTRGELHDGWVYIDSDEIKRGDEIVIDGKNKINDGSIVNIVKK
ncbi:MAG: efflux RND transporter periplasmic adaptor subunit [Porphyromonas sp.]|nr:efflux RND transporter periplasmic adaptor subunit [Porphyromonas sp.]